MTKTKIKAIAFYLPQYHPIPENDRWWGKGFTEWTNVTKAKPLFDNHYQPHLPADLGFYDLRLPEARIAQAELAQEYGIYGFCYYHYWFNGKRLLERPFNEVLATGKPDFPFCLCWANESWSRRWDGTEKEILIQQNYNHEDDRNHIKWLIKAFKDDRYIKVDGKPLFLVYRANQLPNPQQTAEIWREEANKQGVGEIFLARVESFPDEHQNPDKIGFDASVEFQPDWTKLPITLRRILVKSQLPKLLEKINLPQKSELKNYIYDYGTLVDRMIQKPIPEYDQFPCVTPSWDNSARRWNGEAIIIKESTPELYESWLQSVVEKHIYPEKKEQIIFINAWNEWAEGNHLEPCQKWGRSYLEATKKVLNQY